MSGISMLSRSHERSQNFNQEKAPYSRLYVHMYVPRYGGGGCARVGGGGGGGSCAARTAWLRQGCCLIHDGNFFVNFPDQKL